jgi:hypothetical protein
MGPYKEGSMLLLSLLASSAFANEVILPAFDPADSSSAEVTAVVYAAMVDALGDRDIAFLDAQDLQNFVGAAADDCKSRPECPGSLWLELEGELVVLATIGIKDETINAAVEFYRRGVDTPVEFFQAEFPVENAGRFSVDAALIVEDLLGMDEGQFMASGVAASAAAAEGVDKLTEDALGPINPSQTAVAEEKPAATEAPEEPVPELEPLRGRITDVAMSESEERKHMGLTQALYEKYQQSGKDRVQFLADEKYRAKTFYAEIAPGFAFGDVQRRYTAIAALGPEAEVAGYYERDQFLPGTAFALVVGLGYAPTWWLEFGMNIGIEFPKKDFIQGYEAYSSATAFQEDSACHATNECPDHRDITAFKPATALTFLIEPRARILMTPTGLVKPYGIVGWATRFYDGYDTPDAVDASGRPVPYPNRAGAQTYGPLGGLGISFDPRKRASAFVESTYTQLLGPGILDANVSTLNHPPAPLEGSNSVMTIRAGAVTRF